jgi:hypothetical protein
MLKERREEPDRQLLRLWKCPRKDGSELLHPAAWRRNLRCFGNPNPLTNLYKVDYKTILSRMADYRATRCPGEVAAVSGDHRRADGEFENDDRQWGAGACIFGCCRPQLILKNIQYVLLTSMTHEINAGSSGPSS